MIKVKLMDEWFAPTVSMEIGGRHLEGRLYKRGERDLPNELKAHLPKSAVILSEDKALPEKVASSPSLKDHDAERANSDAYAAFVNKVNKKD